eukprot:Skav202217  [mRNA]  locus=scaffold1756:48398:54661:+ [translate_table: standard]
MFAEMRRQQLQDAGKHDIETPFRSIPVCLWWVFTTMTTVGATFAHRAASAMVELGAKICQDVPSRKGLFRRAAHHTWFCQGYGDMVPTTPAGKVVGVVCFYCGVILLALPIGVLSTNFEQAYAKNHGNLGCTMTAWKAMGIFALLSDPGSSRGAKAVWSRADSTAARHSSEHSLGIQGVVVRDGADSHHHGNLEQNAVVDVVAPWPDKSSEVSMLLEESLPGILSVFSLTSIVCILFSSCLWIAEGTFPGSISLEIEAWLRKLGSAASRIHIPRYFSG